jgi:uncharacterized membrane protein
MATIEKSIDVNVPVRTAYDQWTQFEDFPKFMEGVKEVRQLDDKHLFWHADIGGKDVTWNAEITEQVPDKRIAWHSTSGARNDGIVTFMPEGNDRTRVTLRLDYDPQGAVENMGSATGVVGHRVEGDLKRYKDYIESRGHETGAWRGEIHGGDVERGGETKHPGH